MVAVPAVQIREQQHQRKRQRPDKRGNPRPDFEAASPSLGNSAGKKDRNDKTTRATASMMHAPMLPCAEYSMELVARRLAVKPRSNFRPRYGRTAGFSSI